MIGGGWDWDGGALKDGGDGMGVGGGGGLKDGGAQNKPKIPFSALLCIASLFSF